VDALRSVVRAILNQRHAPIGARLTNRRLAQAGARSEPNPPPFLE